MQPVKSEASPLYLAIDELDEPELKDVIKEIIPEETARKVEVQSKAWFWASASTEAEKIAKKVIEVNLLEKILQLHDLEENYHGLENSLKVSPLAQNPENRVELLARKDSYYAQLLQVMDALLKILPADSDAYRPLTDRVAALKLTYDLKAKTIRIDTAKYSATREIFNSIFNPMGRVLPAIPAHKPALTAATKKEATEIQLTTTIEVIQETLTRGEKPASKTPLTLQDKEKLLKLLETNQTQLMQLLEKDVPKPTERIAQIKQNQLNTTYEIKINALDQRQIKRQAELEQHRNEVRQFIERHQQDETQYVNTTEQKLAFDRAKERIDLKAYDHEWQDLEEQLSIATMKRTLIETLDNALTNRNKALETSLVDIQLDIEKIQKNKQELLEVKRDVIISDHIRNRIEIIQNAIGKNQGFKANNQMTPAERAGVLGNLKQEQDELINCLNRQLSAAKPSTPEKREIRTQIEQEELNLLETERLIARVSAEIEIAQMTAIQNQSKASGTWGDNVLQLRQDEINTKQLESDLEDISNKINISNRRKSILDKNIYEINQKLTSNGQSRQPTAELSEALAQAQVSIEAINLHIDQLVMDYHQTEKLVAKDASENEIKQMTSEFKNKIMLAKQASNQQITKSQSAYDEEETKGGSTVGRQRKLNLMDEAIKLEKIHAEQTEVALQRDMEIKKLQILRTHFPELRNKEMPAEVPGSNRIIADLRTQMQKIEATLKDLNAVNRDLIKKMNDGRNLIKARQAVLNEMTPQEQGEPQSLGGNYLSSTIDKSIKQLVLGLEGSWESSEWGTLLKDDDKDGHYAQFRAEINAQRLRRQEVEADKTAIKKRIGELEEQLEGASGAEAYRLLNGQIETLTREWKKLDSESRQAQIAFRGAFMKRITEQTGKIRIHEVETANNLEVTKLQLQTHTRKKAEIQANIERIEQTEATIEQDNTPQTLARLHTLDLEISQYKRKMNEEQDAIDRLNSEIKKYILQIEQDQVAIAALDRGFEKQMTRYRSTKKPETYIFRELAEAYGSKQGRAQATISAGISIYFASTYAAPHTFQCKHEIAKLGYSFKAGMKQLGSYQSLDQLIKEFVRWSDTHPAITESIMADVAMTISTWGNRSLLETFTTGLIARRYTRTIFSGLGTDVSSEKFTEKDFKFFAMADIVRHGPTSAAIPRALITFGQSIAGGSSVLASSAYALVGGTVEYTADRAVQHFVQETSPEILQPLSVLLEIANGVPANQIVAEQRLLATLQLAAQVKDSVLRPKDMLESLVRKFKNSWKILTKAKGLELGLRILTTVVLPTVLVGGAVAALALAAPLGGIGVALGLAFLCVAAAGSSSTFFYGLWNWLYPNTEKSLQHDNAEEFLRSHQTFQDGLLAHREGFIDKLKKRQLIPKLDSDPAMRRTIAQVLWNRPEPLTIERLRSGFSAQLTRALEAEKKLKGDNLIAPEDVIRVYRDVLKLSALKESCDRICEDRGDAAELSRILQAEILSPFFAVAPPKGLLIHWLDEGFRSQFIKEIASYTTPEAYQDKVKKNNEDLLEAHKKLNENFKQSVKESWALVPPGREKAAVLPQKKAALPAFEALWR